MEFCVNECTKNQVSKLLALTYGSYLGHVTDALEKNKEHINQLLSK